MTSEYHSHSHNHSHSYNYLIQACSPVVDQSDKGVIMESY